NTGEGDGDRCLVPSCAVGCSTGRAADNRKNGIDINRLAGEACLIAGIVNDRDNLSLIGSLAGEHQLTRRITGIDTRQIVGGGVTDVRRSVVPSRCVGRWTCRTELEGWRSGIDGDLV